MKTAVLSLTCAALYLLVYSEVVTLYPPDWPIWYVFIPPALTLPIILWPRSGR